MLFMNHIIFPSINERNVDWTYTQLIIIISNSDTLKCGYAHLGMDNLYVPGAVYKLLN